MARPQPTPRQVVETQFAQLRRAIVNLLVDNKNFKAQGADRRAHYFEAYPRTEDYVHGPLRTAAEHILETVDASRDLAVTMAASPDIPGFTRSIEGSVGDIRVAARSLPDGRWALSIADAHAFDDRDDRTFELADEDAAVDAIRSYLADGTLPVAPVASLP